MSMMGDFFGAVLSERPMPADHPLAVARMAACRRCPASFLSANGMFGEGGMRCRICRCFVKLKTRYPSQKCPNGYWK